MADGDQIQEATARLVTPLRTSRTGAGRRRSRPRTLKGLIEGREWFIAIVCLPTLLSALYFGLIASDIYVSEAQYILRTNKPSQLNSVSVLLQNAGISPARDETSLVAEYIMSRDLLGLLETKQAFREVVARPHADFWRRFPRPFGNESFEHFYKAYPRFVDVTLDSATGVTLLRVSAFSAEDSQAAADAILGYSEAFVNRLNGEARRDSLREARLEVDGAQKRVAKAQAALTAHRLKTQMFDPTKVGGAALELIAKLSLEAASARAQLDAVTRDSPLSPQIPVLQNRIRAIDAQLSVERKKVTGDGESLATQLAEFENLYLESRFAEEALAASNLAVETARIEARQKEIYLQRVSEPRRPDYAMEPKRLRGVFLTLISALMAFGILWLLNASIREHAGR